MTNAQRIKKAKDPVLEKRLINLSDDISGLINSNSDVKRIFDDLNDSVLLIFQLPNKLEFHTPTICQMIEMHDNFNVASEFFNEYSECKAVCWVDTDKNTILLPFDDNGNSLIKK